MFDVILKIIFRGGYKTLHLIMLIAAFVAIPLATGLLFSGYISNIYNIASSFEPSFYYGFDYVNDSVKVLYTGVSIDNVSVVILYIDDIESWLSLHRVRVEEIGNGDLYVGSRVYPIIGNILEYLDVNDGGSVKGILYGEGYVEYSVVIPGYIAKSLDYEWNVVYEGLEESWIPVPSMIDIPNIVLSTFSNIIFVLSILLYIILVASIPALLGISIRSSADIRRLFKLVHMDGGIRVIKLVFSTSLLLFGASFVLGLSLAFISVHITSFALNRIFGIPYIRPDIFIGFIEIVVSFFLVGFLSTFLSMLYFGRSVVTSD